MRFMIIVIKVVIIIIMIITRGLKCCTCVNGVTGGSWIDDIHHNA